MKFRTPFFDHTYPPPPPPPQQKEERKQQHPTAMTTKNKITLSFVNSQAPVRDAVQFSLQFFSVYYWVHWSQFSTLIWILPICSHLWWCNKNLEKKKIYIQRHFWSTVWLYETTVMSDCTINDHATRSNAMLACVNNRKSWTLQSSDQAKVLKASASRSNPLKLPSHKQPPLLLQFNRSLHPLLLWIHSIIMSKPRSVPPEY